MHNNRGWMKNCLRTSPKLRSMEKFSEKIMQKMFLIKLLIANLRKFFMHVQASFNIKMEGKYVLKASWRSRPMTKFPV